MSKDDRVVPFPKAPGGSKCPNCEKATVQRYRPFCSGRCADIDLGRWLKGSYSIPTEERPEPFELPSRDTE